MAVVRAVALHCIIIRIKNQTCTFMIFSLGRVWGTPTFKYRFYFKTTSFLGIGHAKQTNVHL